MGRKGLGKLADRPFAAGKRMEHLPACRVAEGVEDGVEPGCI